MRGMRRLWNLTLHDLAHQSDARLQPRQPRAARLRSRGAFWWTILSIRAVDIAIHPACIALLQVAVREGDDDVPSLGTRVALALDATLRSLPPEETARLPLDYGVVADVSATLQNALTNALAPLNAVAEVHDLQGNVATAPARVTLFLFEVSEDYASRNRPRAREQTPPTITVRKAPMALLLRYILTPWSNDRFSDHRMLGRVMQALYDGAVLSGPDLRGGLLGTDQALKVVLSSLTVEERARVWYSVQKPYRLSVVYDVRVVNLVSDVSQEVMPVAERSLRYAEPAGAT